MFGAELGPKADPTTTTYVPRPEWYFFFLFEVLRVIKPAVLTPLATIGVPTICMILLILLPFIDRGPSGGRSGARSRRSPASSTIFAMGYLTYLGAAAGSPNEIEYEVAAKYEAGKLVVAQSGCLACHKIGENGNGGPGPNLTDDRRQAAEGRDPAHAREPDRADAVVRRAARGEEGRDGRLPRAAARRVAAAAADGRRREARTGTLEEGQVRAMFDRIARVYDLHELAS